MTEKQSSTCASLYVRGTHSPADNLISSIFQTQPVLLQHWLMSYCNKVSSLERYMFLFYPFVCTQIKACSPWTVTYNWIKDSITVTDSRIGAWVVYEHKQHNLKIKLHLWSSGCDHGFSDGSIPSERKIIEKIMSERAGEEKRLAGDQRHFRLVWNLVQTSLLK